MAIMYDKEKALAAIKRDPFLYCNVSLELQCDPDIVAATVIGHPDLVPFIHPKIWSDRWALLKMVEKRLDLYMCR